MLDKSPAAVNVPNDLAAHWMPFTANRAFKKAPRLLAGAKDMHYFTVDGRKIIDGAAGMWCCNAGHGRSQIAEAIGKQAADLDDMVSEQVGRHPKAMVALGVGIGFALGILFATSRNREPSWRDYARWQ